MVLSKYPFFHECPVLLIGVNRKEKEDKGGEGGEDEVGGREERIGWRRGEGKRRSKVLVLGCL